MAGCGKLSESRLRSGEDYKSYFDPKAYLDAYHQVDEDKKSSVCCNMSLWHQAVAVASIPDGCRLLDVGTGPCIHSVISAGSRCSEIVCSDFSSKNREELKKWVNGDQDAFDWGPHFEFVCNLEGKSEKWKERQDHIRKAIKHVIPCDVTQGNPLAPLVYEPFDVITTSLCLESSCRDDQTYRANVKHVSSLLKPGGVFIIAGALGGTFYVVGKETFLSFTRSREDVESALANAGLTTMLWVDNGEEMPDSYNPSDDAQNYDCYGFFTACARKN